MYEHIKADWDCIISALILHDSVKKGNNGSTYTVHDHPIAAADFVVKMAGIRSIDESLIETICGLIRSHMGQWDTNAYSSVVLPKPKTASQKFVHMCDYLASRKFITVTNEDGIPLK